jgi:hypothetical protein
VILYVIGAVLVGTVLFLLLRAFWIRAGLTLARVAIALAIAVVTFGLIALVVAGKLSWVFAAAAALVAFSNRLLGVLSVLPILNRLFPNWHKRWTRTRTAQHGATNGSAYSTIDTPELRMTLHHATGHMDGEILVGPQRGRFLSELDRVTLVNVLALLGDAEAKRLLTAYLDRTHAGWNATGGAVAASGMSRDEALAVLGLEAGATPDDIVQAHRRLIQKVHPDRGGSTYLATTLNEAKRVLLDE